MSCVKRITVFYDPHEIPCGSGGLRRILTDDDIVDAHDLRELEEAIGDAILSSTTPKPKSVSRQKTPKGDSPSKTTNTTIAPSGPTTRYSKPYIDLFVPGKKRTGLD